MKILLITVLFFSQCSKSNLDLMNDTPLIVVIKFISAESQLKFEIAKTYMDVDKVFSNSPDSLNVEEEWKEMNRTFYALGSSKKFTNEFSCFNYEIDETINVDEAFVTFTSIDQKVMIKKIIYKLHKTDTWKIVAIEYLN